VNSQGPEQFDFRGEIHAQTAVFLLTYVVFKYIKKDWWGI
jgi:hypothetical protein